MHKYIFSRTDIAQPAVILNSWLNLKIRTFSGVALHRLGGVGISTPYFTDWYIV